MTDTEKTILSYDSVQILDLIPHRYPFLLVDRITECVAGEYAVGYKNLTWNEPFFQGHFPNNPVMPGVLQVEAMAQCSAPIILTMEKYNGKLALFAGMENVRFKGIVRPGDRLDMRIELLKLKGPVAKSHGVGTVDGNVVVEADMTVCIK
ncbi:MAG: 3-hydroxyacyl-ACP dehydratase FabZ [Candidatus Gastranaerophilaceae bacterium]